MSPAKQQALLDMRASKVSTSVIYLEKAILEFTCTTEVRIRRDFRKYNGGHNRIIIKKK